jgi:serine/threonine kinase 32
MSTRSLSKRRKNSKSQPPSLSGSPPTQHHPPMPNGQPASQSSSSPKSREARQPLAATSNAAPLSPYQQSYNRPQRPTGSRKESMGGGMQVVLGETGSWSELAKQDTTLPADAKLVEARDAKPTGMLSFLSRKRGRGHSPKPQERGILGKEGARVVISSGG